MRKRSCYNEKQMVIHRMSVVCFRDVACFGWYGVDQDHECLCVYIFVHMYIKICTVHIFTMHAGCPHSPQCDQ